MLLFARFLAMPQYDVYIVTTKIKHFRTFNTETMDNMAGASGLEDVSINQPPLRPPERRGFKHVVTREERYGKHSGQP
jgi:hypothetical protein